MLKLEQIKSAAVIIAAEYPVTRIDLFGSYANGTSTENSDVDILVEFDNNARISLLTISSLKIRMEELLDTSVDVIHAPIPNDSILEIDKVVSLYAA